MKLKRAVEISLILSAAMFIFIMIAGLAFNRPQDVSRADLIAAGTTSQAALNNAPVRGDEAAKAAFSGGGQGTTTTTDTSTSTGASTGASTNKPATGSTSSGSTGSSTGTGGTSTGGTGGSTGSGGGTGGDTGGGTTTPPPPASTCGQAGGTCTATEVAGHNSKTDCWVVYSGSYYIVTAFVNTHPGGTQAFTSQTCGHDITAYLKGNQAPSGVQKHNHSQTAYNTLNSYKVGSVSP